MPTIKDIAREAGVSHGTVSNVLNKTGKVSIEKIRLVEEAAKRLGYVPNQQAQMLRQGTPTDVAVILPSLREENYLDFYTALQQSLLAAGYHTAAYLTDDIAGKEQAILNSLPLSRLAAIVTVSCLVSGTPEAYHNLPCPVLYAERVPETLIQGQACLTFDFQSVGSAIGQYLLQQGKRRIAFFSSRRMLGFSGQLYLGLSDTLDGEDAAIQCFTSDLNLLTPKAFETVQSDFRCDAIVTSSTLRAEAVSFACHLSKPDPVPELITLGVSENPLFTTYRLDYGKLGNKACALLLSHLQSHTPLPKLTVFAAEGFPYQFPNLIRKKPQTLTMLAIRSPSLNALEKLLPMFEELTNIHLQLTTLAYNDLHTQIPMMNENFHYDLVRMDMARLDLLAGQTYLPLDEAGISSLNLPQQLFRSSYDDYSYANGIRYALPFDSCIQLLLYRKDLFEDATLSRLYYERFHETLTVPESYRQYLQVAEFFTSAQNPDAPTKFGATQTTGSAMTAASDFLPFYLERCDRLFDKKQMIRLDSPEMIDAMTQYQRMTAFSVQERWWDSSMRLFADGQTATTVIYSNHAALTMNTKHSNIVGNIGAGIIPGGHPLLGGGIIGISRYSRKVEACLQFLQWYYSRDIAALLTRLGGTSPVTDADSDFRNLNVAPWTGVARKSFDLGQRGTGKIQIPGFSNYRYEFALGTAVRNLTSGAMTPEQAARFAQTMYDNSL